jgi:hypothetical protein
MTKDISNNKSIKTIKMKTIKLIFQKHGLKAKMSNELHHLKILHFYQDQQ